MDDLTGDARAAAEPGTAVNGPIYMDEMAQTFMDAPDRSRFELYDGDELLGWMDYRPAGSSAILAHTEVAADHEGEGLGGILVRESIDALAAEGRTVIPTCPFAAAYIKRHSELAQHVDRSLRGQFT